MSSASSMLNDMLFKSKRLEKEIQQLDRRLKRVERQGNPLGIFEPDINMLISGALVNCKFRNMIDENEPDKVFQNDGRSDFNLSGNFKQRFCLLKFETPIPIVKGLSINFIKNPIMNFTVTDDGGARQAAMIVDASVVTIGWNPSDVTWNSFTPDFSASPGLLGSIAQNFSFEDSLFNRTGNDLEGTISIFDVSQKILSGVPFTQSNTIGLFTGIVVSLSRRATAEPPNLQSTGDFNGELEIGIKDPIELLSSFAVTI